MDHRLQEGPSIDLLVRGQRLEQVLGQQRHFGVEALGDAPTRTTGVRVQAVTTRPCLFFFFSDIRIAIPACVLDPSDWKI